jgi:hypothetical protein
MSNVTIGDLTPISPIDPAALVEVQQAGASQSVTAQQIGNLTQWGNISGSVEDQADLVNLLISLIQAVGNTIVPTGAGMQGTLYAGAVASYNFTFVSGVFPTDVANTWFVFKPPAGVLTLSVASDFTFADAPYATSKAKVIYIRIINNSGSAGVYTWPSGWLLDASVAALSTITGTCNTYEVLADLSSGTINYTVCGLTSTAVPVGGG